MEEIFLLSRECLESHLKRLVLILPSALDLASYGVRSLKHPKAYQLPSQADEGAPNDSRQSVADAQNNCGSTMRLSSSNCQSIQLSYILGFLGHALLLEKVRKLSRDRHYIQRVFPPLIKGDGETLSLVVRRQY